MKTEIVQMRENHPDPERIEEAGRILKSGGLVAFPTETVYGLGGDALNPEASRKIYAAKGRPSDNPLIVHICKMEDLKEVAQDVPVEALKLADRYWPGPLTMILKRTDKVPLETTGGLETVAVRFPSHPVARALIEAAGGFVAAPSANTSGRPSPTRAEHVIDDLSGRIEMIIDSGPVNIGLESTIVDFTEDLPVILRPGFLNLQMLKEVLGEVRMDQGLIIQDPTVHPKAPGMKYRHYAPKAELLIVKGEAKAVQSRIRSLADEKLREGLRVGILCAEESRKAYPAGDVRVVGKRSDDRTIAQHLFEILRAFDDDGVDIIFSEAFDEGAMSGAIMNRLTKAAGHHILREVDETTN